MRLLTGVEWGVVLCGLLTFALAASAREIGNSPATDVERGAGLQTAAHPETDTVPPSERVFVVFAVNTKRLPGKAKRRLADRVGQQLAAKPAWQLQSLNKKTDRKLAKLAKTCKPVDGLECAQQAGRIAGVGTVLTLIVAGKGRQQTVELIVYDVAASQELGRASGSVGKKSWLADGDALTAQVLQNVQLPADESGGDEEALAKAPFALEPPPPPTDIGALAPKTTVASDVTPPAGAASPAESASVEASEDVVLTSEAAALSTAEVEMIEATAVIKKPVVEAETSVEEPAVQKGSRKPYRFGVGLHVDFLVPSGKAGGPEFNTSLIPDGGRTVAVAILAEGRFFVLPDPVRDLGFSLAIGWYRYGQSAKRDNPADPDFDSFSYRSSMQILPVMLGPVYRIRIPEMLGLPLGLYAGGGFAYQHVWATTKYGSDGVKVVNATQEDHGFGYYLGAEAALRIWLGSLNVGVRFTSVRTDIDFKGIYNNVYNEELGETGGTSLLVGYRFEL